MNSLVYLLLTALATWQITETIHHGSIFDKPRAYLEASGGFFSDLVGCPFCLSHWVAALVVGLSWDTYSTTTSWVIVLFCFASARLAQLGNDLTHGFCRTPRLKLGQDLNEIEKELDNIAAGTRTAQPDPDSYHDPADPNRTD